MRTWLFIALAAALAATFALQASPWRTEAGAVHHHPRGRCRGAWARRSRSIGIASLQLNSGQREVCLDISWADVDGEVFAVHIHAMTATVAGPVVVTLFTGAFA